MLLRILPSKEKEILSSFSFDTQKTLTDYAKTATAINSKLLLKLLEATDLTQRSPIPQAPLELVIIDTITE
jgi:hypothetical protein